MKPNRKDLGVKSDIEAVLSLLDVGGLNLIDVGCGPGGTARELCAAGASVLALEPDPVQAAENAKTSPPEGLVFAQARAEEIPAGDGACDGVLFFRSLHHVPIDSMERAIDEAIRTLAPDRGFLCFVEPAMEGSHFALMRPFHDETRVRTAAQAALDRFAAPRFGERRRYVYRQFPRYENFDAMVARFAGRSFEETSREDIETDEVRRLFAAARNVDGEYIFEQPMLLDLFRTPLRR